MPTKKKHKIPGENRHHAGWYNNKVKANRRVDKLSGFTTRELRVVLLVTKGYKNLDIAKKINTTEFVVKNIMRDIFDATGFSNRLHVALWCLRQQYDLFKQQRETKSNFTLATNPHAIKNNAATASEMPLALDLKHGQTSKFTHGGATWD